MSICIDGQMYEAKPAVLAIIDSLRTALAAAEERAERAERERDETQRREKAAAGRYLRTHERWEALAAENEELRLLVADAWGEGLRCGHSRALAGRNATAVTEDWMASTAAASLRDAALIKRLAGERNNVRDEIVREATKQINLLLKALEPGRTDVESLWHGFIIAIDLAVRNTVERDRLAAENEELRRILGDWVERDADGIGASGDEMDEIYAALERAAGGE